MNGVHGSGAHSGKPMFQDYAEYKKAEPWDIYKDITGYKHLSNGVIAVVVVLALVIIVMAILLFIWAATNGAVLTNSVATGCAITLGCLLFISGAIHVWVCAYYGVPIKASRHEAARRGIIPRKSKQKKERVKADGD